MRSFFFAAALLICHVRHACAVIGRRSLIKKPPKASGPTPAPTCIECDDGPELDILTADVFTDEDGSESLDTEDVFTAVEAIDDSSQVPSLTPSERNMPSSLPSDSYFPSSSPSDSNMPSESFAPSPGKGKGGKGGKGSAVPSTFPSLSNAPSNMPSDVPSLWPSLSSVPSSSPSISYAPSESFAPTCHSKGKGSKGGGTRGLATKGSKGKGDKYAPPANGQPPLQGAILVDDLCEGDDDDDDDEDDNEVVVDYPNDEGSNGNTPIPSDVVTGPSGGVSLSIASTMILVVLSAVGAVLFM